MVTIGHQSKKKLVTKVKKNWSPEKKSPQSSRLLKLNQLLLDVAQSSLNLGKRCFHNFEIFFKNYLASVNIIEDHLRRRYDDIESKK